MHAARATSTNAELLQAATARLRAVGIDTAQLDAEVLLALALHTDRAGLYARLRNVPSADAAARFTPLVERRARREPVAYITGVQEFWSLPFAVNPSVLIPRPETERLVEIACRLWRQGSVSPRRADSPAGDAGPNASRGSSVCDVGTGSGCIAVALASELGGATITAVDSSVAALAVAAGNAAAHGVAHRIAFVRGDLFDALDPETCFDLIVCNPPYLAADDVMTPEVAFEPGAALTAGRDGLAVIRRLIASAPDRLRRSGWLVMELGLGQDVAVRELARAAGLVEIEVEPDLAGIARVLVARRP
jgi:release factor glutamine methyltransferase